MSFSTSSSRIRLLDDHHSLSANCRRNDGSCNASILRLDALLGNENGHFRWGLQAFSSSAHNVRLKGSVLHADLSCFDGVTWTHAKVDLNDHVRNNDGVLEGFAIPVVVLTPQEEKEEPVYLSDVPDSGELILPILGKHEVQAYHRRGSNQVKGWHMRLQTSQGQMSVTKVIKNATDALKRVKSKKSSSKSSYPYPTPAASSPSSSFISDGSISELDLTTTSIPTERCRCDVCFPHGNSFHDDEIKSLKVQLRESAQTIFDRDMTISAYNDRAAFLSADLAVKEEELAELDASAQRTTALLLESQNREAQLNDALVKATGVIENDKVAIASLKAIIAEKDLEIAGRGCLLAASEDRILSLLADLADREKKVADQDDFNVVLRSSLKESKQHTAALRRENLELAATVRRIISGQNMSRIARTLDTIAWCAKVVCFFFALPFTLFGIVSFIYRNVRRIQTCNARYA